MTTTLTFKKRTTKRRRAEVLAVVQKKFHATATATEDGIAIRHRRDEAMKVIWMFMFARCFTDIK